MSGTGSAGTAIAGVTPVGLYRFGNSANAKMDNVRPQDATIYPGPGRVDWVKANSGRGISCSSVPYPSGKQWWLAPGSPIPSVLVLVNNRRNHWQWEPANDMPLADFKVALASTHPFFK